MTSQPSIQQTKLSRRKFVKLAGGTVALTAFATWASPLLAACSSGNQEPTPETTKPATQVIIAMTPGSEPAAGFDPFYSWGCGEHQHEPLIQSTLIATDINMQFVNDLATDYQVSDDGLTWTFTIRGDVKFSNESPLTAKDVAFTLNGIKNAEGSETDLSMIKTVLATSDTSLEIKLEKPYNALLYTLAVIGIVSEESYGPGYGQNPIGSGRYILEQWDQGQQVIFAANPNYYGNAPLMERVIVVFMEEDAALAAARSGQVDLATTSAVYSSQSIENYQIFAAKSVDSRGISLPTILANNSVEQDGESVPAGNDVTADIAVRRALNYVADRNAMIDNVLNGYGSVAYSVSDSMPWASTDMKVETNVELAKQTLANAGWVAGSDGVLEKDGLRASLALCYPAGDSVRQSLANEFANQAGQVGIEIKTEGLGWDEIYPRAYSDPILWGWGSNSPTELYSLYHSKSSSNFASYANATIDSYLDQALATPTIEESFALWQKAQWDGQEGEAPKGAATWVWFANIDHLYFKRDALIIAEQKLHPHGHGWSIANNVDQWFWQ